MPISVEVQWDDLHRKDEASGNPSRSRQMMYLIQGTDDILLARQALEAVVPLLWDGLVYSGSEVRQTAPDVMHGVATFSLPPTTPNDDSSSLFSFTTSGGTAHITQSISTRYRVGPNGDTASNLNGAIGVTQDSVEGVDIVVPKFEFTIPTKKPAAIYNLAVVKAIANLVGTTNLNPWLTFARGELLFLGVDGGLNNAGEVELGYKFAASPNVSNLTFQNIGGGTFTVPLKRGWEYLHFRYRQAEDTTKKRLIRTLEGVYVEQVYYETNFSLLGI